MNLDDRQRVLLQKYLLGNITDQERDEVDKLISDPVNKQLFDEVMDEMAPDLIPETETEQDDIHDKLQEFKNRYAISTPDLGGRSSDFRKWIPYTVAAAVLLMISCGWWIYTNIDRKESERIVYKTKENLPGSQKALLMLADGSTISLADAKSGELAEQLGVRIEKTAEGEIVYHRESQSLAGSPVFNKVVTPNGGQYRVILPDGSKAWLNAASSLSYPTNFEKNVRRVRMTGEVYFEVAKVNIPNSQQAMPFFVETDKQIIQVLGTQFNINAYPDEPYVTTTLVEGSVRVTSSSSGRSILLKPGQESLLSDKIDVQVADIQQQLAWKNGEFIFKGEYLEDMLKQLARWYDLEIVCPSRYGKIRFSGIISRSMPLSTVIDMIESTEEVKINIEGRRLIVSD